MLLQQLGDDRFLAIEIRINRPPGEARFLSNRFDGRATKACSANNGLRGGKYSLSVIERCLSRVRRRSDASLSFTGVEFISSAANISFRLLDQ